MGVSPVGAFHLVFFCEASNGRRGTASLPSVPVFAPARVPKVPDAPQALGKGSCMIHRENGGTLGMVPLIINPIYTLSSGYLLGISPFIGYALEVIMDGEEFSDKHEDIISY